MRRADRLFRIVQLLRGKRRVTASYLAQMLEVSERTIYRDMQDLSLSGVPILGEAGSGYRLLPGFDLPPLMFNEEELMALLLGVRMVRAWSDPALSQATEQVLNKIESVLPARLRPELSRSELMAPGFSLSPEVGQRLAVVRKAIRAKCKLCLSYTREDGVRSQRVIRPLGMVYWGKVWTLVAWCELRDDFRHFRLDRMRELEQSDMVFMDESGKTLQDFFMTLPVEDRA
jgi:predicted DNA-binding transcriptional regulator YafY